VWQVRGNHHDSHPSTSSFCNFWHTTLDFQHLYTTWGFNGSSFPHISLARGLTSKCNVSCSWKVFFNLSRSQCFSFYLHWAIHNIQVYLFNMFQGNFYHLLTLIQFTWALKLVCLWTQINWGATRNDIIFCFS
jgi:hypothetical protein